jgi:hypothetical protein
MMTVHEDNRAEVWPLARALERRSRHYLLQPPLPCRRRAALRPPDPGEFRQLLRDYVQEEHRHPLWGFKDNPINHCLTESGREPCDDCTGFGCSTAFNFLVMLPDGEMPACRKFPSAVGNFAKNSPDELYFSPVARRYRSGFEACDGPTVYSKRNLSPVFSGYFIRRRELFYSI